MANRFPWRSLYDQKNNYFDITPISNFKNLESLSLYDPDVTNDPPAVIYWNQLKNIKVGGAMTLKCFIMA